MHPNKGSTQISISAHLEKLRENRIHGIFNITPLAWLFGYCRSYWCSNETVNIIKTVNSMISWSFVGVPLILTISFKMGISLWRWQRDWTYSSKSNACTRLIELDEEVLIKLGIEIEMETSSYRPFRMHKSINWGNSNISSNCTWFYKISRFMICHAQQNYDENDAKLETWKHKTSSMSRLICWVSRSRVAVCWYSSQLQATSLTEGYNREHHQIPEGESVCVWRNLEESFGSCLRSTSSLESIDCI